MSGPFGSSPWGYNPGGGGFYSYSIDQSLRFEDGDSAYLTRNPSQAGDRQKFTYSVWFKRGNLSASEMDLFSAGNSSTDRFEIILSAAYPDQLSIYMNNGGTIEQVRTSQVFRDVSAWYHLVVAFDTTQGTESNRLKVYVNGSQVTDFSTYDMSTANFSTAVNSTSNQYISKRNYVDDRYYDGYMAEINMIDGQQLDSSSFGETKDGIWIPKAYSGSYGINGFKLDFADSSAIGNDVSGKNNDFTVSGGGSPTLVASDVVPDSPTNNWCTLNPLNGDGGSTWSQGNLKISSANKGNNASTFFMESGKWYWEATGEGYVGAVCAFDKGEYTGSVSGAGSGSIGYYTNGNAYWSGSNYNSTPASYTSSDIIGVAVNMVDGEISFYKNNSLQVTLAFSSTESRLATEGCYANFNNGATTAKVVNINFGQDSSFANTKTSGSANATDGNGVGDFYYAPPSGFLALCSANLPEPNIIDGTEYFNTVLYTGNDSTNNITGVGFSPDWVWLKQRNANENHFLTDSVRGAGLHLRSDANTAESDNSATFTTFGADGFSLTGSGSAAAQINDDGDTYVAWNWLAGTAFSNDAGANGATIASTGQVNTTAGFSIVSFSCASGVTSGTVSHGLSVQPQLLIGKTRNHNVNWYVETPLLAENLTAILDTTDAWYDPGYNHWNDTYPTNAVFSVGGYMAGHSDLTLPSTKIVYAFANVEGYSKVGTYGGNNATTFVYTGFRPAWLMIKNTEEGTGADWGIFDNTRPDGTGGTSGVKFLQADIPNGEGNSSTVSCFFFSNGFEIGTSNVMSNKDDDKFIYLAFAEQPFKYANAR